MADCDLESTLVDLVNIQETLAHSSYWALSQLGNDEPLGKRERDAMIGAVEAMGWAVERAYTAWEAELKARRGGEA